MQPDLGFWHLILLPSTHHNPFLLGLRMAGGLSQSLRPVLGDLGVARFYRVLMSLMVSGCFMHNIPLLVAWTYLMAWTGLTRDRRTLRTLLVVLAWMWSTPKLDVNVMAKGEKSTRMPWTRLTLFSFVEFETAEDLKVAVDKLDNTEFKGANVHCISDVSAHDHSS